MVEQIALQQVNHAHAKHMSGRSTCQVSAAIPRLLQQTAVPIFREYTAGVIAVPKQSHATGDTQESYGRADLTRSEPVSVTGTVVRPGHMSARASSVSDGDDSSKPGHSGGRYIRKD
jgi:hypothetical protein